MQVWIFYVLLVCVYNSPPAINIFMFCLPIHTMLVVKSVVGLVKGFTLSEDRGWEWGWALIYRFEPQVTCVADRSKAIFSYFSLVSIRQLPVNSYVYLFTNIDTIVVLYTFNTLLNIEEIWIYIYTCMIVKSTCRKHNIYSRQPPEQHKTKDIVKSRM